MARRGRQEDVQEPHRRRRNTGHDRFQRDDLAKRLGGPVGREVLGRELVRQDGGVLIGLRGGGPNQLPRLGSDLDAHRTVRLVALVIVVGDGRDDLLDEHADAGNDLWTVITRGENGISPTVTYGVVPAGATQLTEPAVLEAGTAYKIVLARFTGPGDADGELPGHGLPGAGGG